MSDENPFHPAKLAAMREEILRDGLLVDRFLSTNPDVPTYGVNLACAWPFPEAWRPGYERMARQLSALGPSFYVYPFEFTHVTLVTFVSFARHTHPEGEFAAKLKTTIPGVLTAMAPLFEKNSAESIKPFSLQPQMPVLARGAGILPLLNSDGEVQRLRQRTIEVLQLDPNLHEELAGRGLNVPGIIHSTIMRFRQAPPDLPKFLAAFYAIVAETQFPPVEVREVLLTSETKPYMRGGEILRRFDLAAALP